MNDIELNKMEAIKCLRLVFYLGRISHKKFRNFLIFQILLKVVIYNG